jgi:SPP1 family holin
MKNVSKETIARTIILAVALINQILVVLGINPLPFAEEELYNIISTIATAAAALWTWWKNNSFSPEAIQADKYLNELKTGDIQYTEE